MSQVKRMREQGSDVEPLRVPPHSVEAEQSVIGSMLLAPECRENVAGMLGESDFYRRDHRLIYRAIGELAADGKPFDAVTLGEWFEAHSLADQIGGSGYLIELSSNTPSAANVGSYAEIVREKAQLRETIEVGNDLVNSAFRPEGRTSAQILSDARNRIEAFNFAADEEGFLSLDELVLDESPIEWLSPGLLSEGSFALVFGAAESGKTFFVAGLVYPIAKVQRRGVYYVLGEGFRYFGRRLRALRTVQGCSDRGVPFFTSKQPAVLTDPASVATLIAHIERVVKRTGVAPAVIVFDTWARSFRGDENSAEDVGEAVAALDGLRHRFGCAVLLVHHSGHGDKERARGSSVLRGALDWEFKVERAESNVTVTCTKAKDAPHPDPMYFELRQVELSGQERDGRPQTSAILHPLSTSRAPSAASSPRGLGARQGKALAVLRELYDQHQQRLEAGNLPGDTARVLVDDWRRACDFDRRDFSKTKTDLAARGAIHIENPYVRLL